MDRGSRPSHTAAKTARIFVFLGRDPKYGPLLPAGAAEATERLCLATGAMEPWMVEVYEKPWFRRLLMRTAESLGAGQTVRMGLRKRFLDDEVRAAIAAGARQVLLVGAGYDTLCMRLAEEFPALRFVEIDHPNTHASKRAGVEALAATRDNLHLVGADLGERTLASALAEVEGWDPEAMTICAAEGVLMYLEAPAVRTFFERVAELTGPGSRLAFTWMRCDERGRPATGKVGGLMRLSMKLIGERLSWCADDEGALEQFLAPLGWRYGPDRDRFELGRRYLEPAGLGESIPADPFEFMAVAERE